jgi:hypothetical protein
MGSHNDTAVKKKNVLDLPAADPKDRQRELEAKLVATKALHSDAVRAEMRARLHLQQVEQQLVMLEREIARG